MGWRIVAFECILTPSVATHNQAGRAVGKVAGCKQKFSSTFFKRWGFRCLFSKGNIPFAYLSFSPPILSSN